MYTKGTLAIFHVNTTGQSTGERVVTNADGIVDINELHISLNDPSRVVKLCLHSTNGVTVSEQYFDCTAKLVAEKDTYVFSVDTRNESSVVVRKMIMEFNDFDEEEKITVKYFSS